ncbi:MAG: homocysteine S-methyltransferase family protein [Fidelibacterota bacterium]|nr:MAG: homocysteine S-methyltransferase family protein [Candidatus Neomarinimicrobiota bacterium]
MLTVLERLRKGEILVADGAMGTMLFQEGLQPGECPESYNLTRPEIVEELARRYLEVGADIIQTNTFGASSLKLAEFGLDEKTEEINQRAVDVVRKAVGDQAIISGSCGPSGRILEPYGDVSEEIIAASFQRQMQALIHAGVDMICVETMIDLREATQAIRAAKGIDPRIPVIATMTFDDTLRGFYTVMGTSIEEAAEGLQAAGADIIGSNCGNGIEIMVRIAQAMKASTSLPVMIQSNAGQPVGVGGQVNYPETPDLFAEKTRELIDTGVSIIGGCCGTNPAHIRAIRRVVTDTK